MGWIAGILVGGALVLVLDAATRKKDEELRRKTGCLSPLFGTGVLVLILIVILLKALTG